MPKSIASKSTTLCDVCNPFFESSPPLAESLAELVHCKECGRRQYVNATAPPQTEQLLVGNEAFRDFSPVRHLSHQREATRHSLFKSLGEKHASPADRRMASRQQISVPLVAVPLDGKFRPLGPSCEAMSFDVSPFGVAFLVGTSQETSYWLLDFSENGHPGSQAIMQPIRVEMWKDELWKIAGLFISHTT